MTSERRSDSATSDRSASSGVASEKLERQPIGGYLRRQRELRGVSAEELASLTRIPLRSLERLEAGTFDDEVDGFVRGFVRTVAEALGLDPDDTLSRMLSEPRADEPVRFTSPSALPRALVGLMALLLLLAAVGLVRVLATSDSRSEASASAPGTVQRRDPVRALAESQAASPDRPGDAADVSAPPPATASDR